MKKFVTAFALGLAFGAVAPAPITFVPQAEAQARRTLTGEWQGFYVQGPDNRSVPFTASLTERGDGRLAGTTLESNTFGDNSSFWLFADVLGNVSGETVRWTKVYDGTAGQSHSVQYEGRITNGGRRIVGTWSLSGAGGSFEMAR